MRAEIRNSGSEFSRNLVILIALVAGFTLIFGSRQAFAASGRYVLVAENGATSSSGQSGTAARAHRTRMHRESVEDRIRNLRAQLKITPAEEANWGIVAETMRNNAAAMKKMIDEERVRGTQGRTALDDLKTYQRFSQAHADAMRRLLDAFTVLYNAMPPDQQKIADEVFGRYEHRRVKR